MGNEKQNYKAIFAIIILIYAVAFALCWNRLYYGVEISDEAFYVAEAYIISNGAIPFTNNFSVASGSFLLSSPIVKLFTAVSGGTEGIYLFMRQAFLIYKLLVSIVLVILFKRMFPIKLAFLLPLPYFAMCPFSINNFSYNTISLSLLLMSCTMLLAACQKNERYAKQFSFAGGVLMALNILSHPLNLFTALYVFVLLIIIERIYFKTSIRSCLFFFGGLLAAIIVTAYLAIISGGLRPIFEGISTILRERPRNHQKGVGFEYNLSTLFGMRHIFGIFVVSSVIALFFVLLFNILRKPRIRRNDAKTILVISLLLAQTLNVAILIYQYSNTADLTNNICISGIFIAVLLLFVCSFKKHIVFVLLFIAPFVVNYLLYMTQPDGLSGRGYILFPSIIVCIALTYVALENTHMPLLGIAKKSIVIHVGSILLTAVICSACVLNFYIYVYRDAPVHSLSYKMESGVFKGLYTLEERGKALIYLEQEIQKVTDSNDLVLFRDQSPQAYLMTNAKHCAPSTWDSLQYSYGYNNLFDESYDSNNDFLLQEYFRAIGHEPDIIIYVQDNERLEHLSLWDNDFKFTQFVKQNYTQTYANNAEQFGIVVFVRNP